MRHERTTHDMNSYLRKHFQTAGTCWDFFFSLEAVAQRLGPQTSLVIICAIFIRLSNTADDMPLVPWTCGLDEPPRNKPIQHPPTSHPYLLHEREHSYPGGGHAQLGTRDAGRLEKLVPGTVADTFVRLLSAIQMIR